MKRVFSFLLIIAILCTITVPCFAANPSKLTISSNKSSAIVGDIITVTVNVSANSMLGGLDFYLNYDKECFEYINSSASSLFDSAITNDSVVGKVRFAGMSNGVISKSGTLLTAKFKVVKINGNFSLEIIEAVDADNNVVNSLISASPLKIKCSHANAKWVITKNATCTEKGSEIRECTCGDKSTREISLAKHTFGDWVITKEATETEKGAKERICKVCSKKETADINKIAPTQPVTDIETETQTQAPTETQSQTETTTIPQNQDTNKTDAKPIVVGAIFFVVGIAVGIGATWFIIKRKAKEEE